MSVFKDGKTWTVQCRVKNPDGTVKQHKKRGFTTKKAAMVYQNKITSEEPKSHMTLKEFYLIYLEDKKNELKPRSILTKRHMIETHILPYFGNCNMGSVTTQQIQNWHNEMYQKGYKETYLRMISNQLSGMFNHACNIYDMPSNPYRKIKKMGKSDANRIDFWTYDQYQTFIGYVKDDQIYYPLFETLYFTGLREGELLALTKENVDLDKKIIYVRHTYYRRNKTDYITVPKTETSVRDVTIPDFLAEELKEYMGQFYKLGNDERIFKMTAEAIQHKMKRIISKAELPMIRVHSLRHSHVAYLCNLGVAPLLIKERLGHKDIRVTLNT